MPSPTLVDTWFTRAEVSFPSTTDLQATQRSFLWMVKAAYTDELTGGSTSGTRGGSSAWTVEGSSNGVAGAMDAVDRWGSTFTAGNLIRAAEGVAHSWIVLKSPNALGPYYLLLNYNGASEGQASVVISKNPFTGGSAIARPTSTGETAVGTATVPTAVSMMAVESIFGVTYRFGYSVNNDGEMHIWCNRAGTGVFNGYMCTLKIRNQHVSDLWNVFATLNFVASGRGAGIASTMFGSSVGALRTPNLAARVATGGVQSAWTFGGFAFESAATLDVLTSTYTMLPFSIYTNDVGQSAYRGKLQDIWMTGNPTVGGSYPNSGAQTQMVVGSVLVPCGVVCAV